MRPATLFAVVGMARLYEARSLTHRQLANLESKRVVLAPIAMSVRMSSSTIKRLTPKQMQERRNKGLCFNCNEKFRPGHKCKKLFSLEACWPEEEETLLDDDEEGGHMEVEETTLESLCMPYLAPKFRRQCAERELWGGW